MTEHRCAWRNCENAGYLFCDDHYPEVFEQVSKDGRLIIERLRLEQRWATYIYFIPTTDGCVKIGSTNSPSRRLDEWSLAEPTYLITRAVVVRGSEEVELEIGEIFTGLASIEREVFCDDPAIWELASKMQRAGHNLLALEWAVRGSRTGRQMTAPV